MIKTILNSPGYLVLYSLGKLENGFDNSRFWFLAAVSIIFLLNIIFLILARIRGRRKEIALQKQNEQLQLITENVLDLIVQLDTRANMTYISNSIQMVLGYAREQLLNTNSLDIIHPGDAPIVHLLFHSFLSSKDTREVVKYEIRLRHKEGFYVWCAAIAHVIFDSDGVLRGAVITLRDISDQKKQTALIQAQNDELLAHREEMEVQNEELINQNFDLREQEKLLKQSEEKYHRLFDTMAQGVVYQNENGEIISANPAAERALGLTFEQMMRRTSYDPRWKAIHEDGSEYRGDEHPSIVSLKTGEPVENVIIGIYHPSEERYHWLIVSSIPEYKKGDKKPYQVYTTFTDITEIKNLELAFHNSQLQFRMLFDNMNEGVAFHQMIYGGDGKPIDYRILDINQQYETILGIKREDVVGKKASEVYGTSAPPYVDEYHMVAERGVPYQFDTYFAPMDKYFHISVVQMGKDYFSTIFFDISKSKRIENEINRLNQSLEQRVIDRTNQLSLAVQELEAFSYSVSHDLRAPLRVIDGFSKALEEDYEILLDDSARDYIRRIRSASKRMAVLIDDLLRLSHVSRSEIHITECDLAELARDIVRDLLQTNPDRRVEVTIPPSMVVNADMSLMRVMLENLFRNSWKFTSKHPVAHIELGEREENGRRVFFVKDDGAGFDETYAYKLFKAFQRLHKDEEFEGTGIGLAIVNRIIQRHGGVIRAEGKKDQGAIFSFTLDSGQRKN